MAGAVSSAGLPPKYVPARSTFLSLTQLFFLSLPTMPKTTTDQSTQFKVQNFVLMVVTYIASWLVKGHRTDGASTLTCCTRLLSESHWQTSFARICRKNRELGATSCTGDSQLQQFSGKTQSSWNTLSWGRSWC